MSIFTHPTLPTRESSVLRRWLFILLLSPLALMLGAWSFQEGNEKVTMRERDVPLLTVFKSIKKQTGYRFYYTIDYVNDQSRVSIDVKNASVEDVLQTVLGREYTWVYNENAVSISKKKLTERKSNAAPVADSAITQITVTGSVTDSKGTPIPGATVLVKGTHEGASTDEYGSFSLAGVRPNAVLVISSVGFEKREVEVKGRRILAQLNVSANDLDEAVVVAYNTTTQRANTGAVTVVRGEQIQTLPNRSFDKSLQGMVPGLLVTSGTGQPGGSVSNFVLRGIATATVGAGLIARNPLIVIDGIPVSQENFQFNFNTATPVTNPLSQLNPSDIETISILKDAAAIALYGSRASNGVIVVTTRKGKSGRTVFNFQHQTDISSRLKGKVHMLNQEEYLDLLYETYKNTSRVIGGVQTPWTDADILTDLKSKFPTQTNGSFYPAPDWLNETYTNNATTISNNLSVSGGNGTNLFYLNLEYTKQNGIIKHTGYDRKSLRFNFETRPENWLKFGINTTFSYNLQDYGNTVRGPDGALNATISPLNPIRLADGSYVFNYKWGTDNSTLPNPVAAAEYNINRNTAYRGLGKMYAELDFLKDFKFTSSIGVDFMLAETKEKADPRLYDRGIKATGGRIEEQDIRRANIITTNILRYNKAINDDHLFGITLGQEAQVLNQKNQLVAVTGLAVPYYDQISSPGVTILRQAGFTKKETLQSFFGQGNYAYKNRYFLTASLRRDGSSRFGNDKRYGTYWSTGIGWVITSEPFMRPVSGWLDYLKIRGSIGAAGNAGAIDANTQYDKLQNTTFLGGTAVYSTNTPGNPDVRWEQTFTWDGGLESRFLKERISITADFYQRNTSDLIYNVNLPANSGYQNVLANIGKMKNNGIELSVSADIIRNEKFNWTLNATWSANRNVLVKANTPLAAIGGTYLYNKEGESFNSFYLAKWAGVNPEDGSSQWIDSTGKVTSNYGAAKKEFVGKPQPDGYGALTNTFVYKGIELSAMLYYQYGYQIYNQDYLVNDGFYPYLNQDKRALDRWQKPGDIAANPKRVLNNPSGGITQASTRYLYKGDHIRLQRVTLAYNFPKRMTERLHLNVLKVFLQGYNLVIWDKFPGQDISNVNATGYTDNSYPNQRTFSFGLNASF